MEEMPDNNTFDKFIHKEMNDLRIDLSSDEQWHKLEADLNKTSISKGFWKRFYLYTFIGVVLIALIAVSLYTNTSSKKPVDSSIPKDSSPISKSDVSSIQGEALSHNNSLSKKSETYQNLDIQNDSLNNSKNIPAATIISTDSSHASLSDSVSSVHETSVPVILPTETKTPSKVKKIRYVTKRDTLFVADTTIARKKR